MKIYVMQYSIQFTMQNITFFDMPGMIEARIFNLNG